MLLVPIVGFNSLFFFFFFIYNYCATKIVYLCFVFFEQTTNVIIGFPSKYKSMHGQLSQCRIDERQVVNETKTV